MTVCRLLSYQDSFSQGLDMYFHKYFLKEKNELVTCILNSLLKDLIVTIFLYNLYCLTYCLIEIQYLA